MSSSDEFLDDLPECFEVFISHRSISPYQELSNALKAKFDDRGIRCFLDEKSLHAGDVFASRIVESIRRSRLVVVFFPKEMSPWLHFEAACAFFDQKLLPIAVDDGVVPPPYNCIQHEAVTTSLESDALERITKEVERRVHGEGHRIDLYRIINHLFFKGFNILFAGIFALLILHLRPGQHVDHLHVIFGAVILGGQFFLSIGFARIAASPSFQERKFGFNTVERLLLIWAVLAIVQPLLGLWLALSRWGVEIPSWVWISLILHLLGLLFTAAGYILAKDARELDSAHADPQSIAGRDLLANISFLLGFIVMVGVINLMLVKTRAPFEMRIELHQVKYEGIRSITSHVDHKKNLALNLKS
jgi:TIR domain